jgi:hypothetical protein
MVPHQFRPFILVHVARFGFAVRHAIAQHHINRFEHRRRAIAKLAAE